MLQGQRAGVFADGGRWDMSKWEWRVKAVNAILSAFIDLGLGFAALGFAALLFALAYWFVWG